MDQHSQVTHWPHVTLPAGNAPLVDPLYLSTKFTADTLEDLEQIAQGKVAGYFYSRIANPTVTQLELLLAKLQKQEAALAVSSGMAAITTCLLSFLRAGDHVVLFIESYRPTRLFIMNFLKKFGVEYSLCSLAEQKPLPIIPGKTKLVLFESPTNPLALIQDISSIIQQARAAGALTVLDNTFAGLHQHGDFPIDLYIHSLTKFAAGHGDVMGGVIIGPEKIIAPMRNDTIGLGPVLDPQAAYFILRGMKTYFLRFQQQAQNALAVAQNLENHPRISHLLYPFLPSHPQYQLAQKQLESGGNIISFNIISQTQRPEKTIHDFIRKLKMIKLAVSLGSTESMVAPVEMFFAADLSEEQKRLGKIQKNSMRLSVGIEDLQDIIADLQGALEN